LPEEYGAKLSIYAKMLKVLKTLSYPAIVIMTRNGNCQLYCWCSKRRQIECTINGIGERAGNTALESGNDFKQHPYLNLYTDIETKQLNEMSRLVLIVGE
jgi:2-isopropylmalate synthase